MLAHVVAIAAALMSVPIPLLLPMLVDEVLLDQPGTAVALMSQIFPAAWQGPILYVGAVLLLSVVLRLAAMGFTVWQSLQFTRIAKDVTYRMRRELLARLERVSMAEYETLGSGRVTSHFVTDMEAVDQFVGTTVGRFLIAVLMLGGTGLILLWMHWPLAVFILFMNPLVVYFTTVLGKYVKEFKRRENAAFEIFQQALTETLDAIHQIRASNRERHYLRQVTGRARGVRDHGTEFAWRSDAAGRFSFLIFLIGIDVFRAVSMLLVVFSDLTVGQMMAVFSYLWYMMSPVQEVLSIQYTYYGATAALTRINRLMNLRPEPVYPHRQDPFSGKHTVGVHVDDVCFAYHEAGLPVLDHLSLTIRSGEKVALVGASGGGKSTLVQVILGLYTPASGQVCFDGVPATEIGLDVVRENVAVVLQHPALLNDTVRNNLTLGRELADTALWQALCIAQLSDDVAGMPQGLDSVIGRQGLRLSGGQRQRLAIARMILSNPKVVILDEATSALDTETEARLHEAMHTFLEHRTTLIVAHRLSAVKQADRVYVFDAGKIIEEGEHNQLMQNGGLYSKLYGHYQTA
ncbi:MAG: ABC transporter ATP-binding protein [Gammaproteobacteria bacterium]|nr:ABC transporter ATP-binding protein [Gammaproteobacteria bacterium]NIR84945.1 ABC transporter ATP-binding protein [Gammaproteobacteria bacterium]NIR91794.1 ABC transporter ATP-binding protein [Gammaproteobacteria bacterium]NIU05992.1 ABC transporter ATP-binding protein [Gammaproteobacteria bacterium]NIV53039.1 ATP-binding cassette domain-containing protein [Gammaproteobacteria bacterium]